MCICMYWFSVLWSDGHLEPLFQPLHGGADCRTTRHRLRPELPTDVGSLPPMSVLSGVESDEGHVVFQVLE